MSKMSHAENLLLGVMFALFGSIAIGGTKVIWVANRAEKKTFPTALVTLGYVLLVCGEISSFTAYAFAPASLVTAIGCLAIVPRVQRLLWVEILFTLVLTSIGSLIVILHSSEEPHFDQTSEIWSHVLAPGFLFYCVLVAMAVCYITVVVIPKHRDSSIWAYLTTSCLAGSLQVLFIKCISAHVRLILSNENSNSRRSLSAAVPITWVFFAVLCGIVQVSYLHEAVRLFPTEDVMPSYYILLNVMVVVGSLFLRGEWGDKVGMVSALCGVYTIFCAIYLLQHSLRATKTSRVAKERIRDIGVVHPPITQSATLFVLNCNGGDQTNEKEPLLQRGGYDVSIDP